MGVEFLILIAQCAVMLWLKSGVVMYVIEGALVVLMLAVNFKPIKELVELLVGKFLKRGRKAE
jgi:hypothetical protein